MGKSSTTIRDFLYLDIDRVRSLLAQIAGGVVEQVVERMRTGADGRAGASVFGIFDIGGGLVREKASEQTKTLQDALYLVFEPAAEETGLLATPECLHDPSAWESDGVHETLKEGQIIRVDAPARIFDSSHFRQSVERFAEWPRVIASFAHSDELASTQNAKQREKKLDQLAAATMGGFDKQLMLDLANFVESFMAGQISLRQFPCGVDHPDFSLVGTLLGQPGFLQEHRDALYGKYGSAPASWTVVSQIATVPPRESDTDDFGETNLVNEDERISRREFEDMAAGLMRYMETQGLSQGPVYPSVAVTPVAVYREVGPAEG